MVKYKIRKHPSRYTFGFKWVAITLVVATVVVFGIVCLVNMGTPNNTQRVKAMQDGISAVYPEYTPRGYALTDIISENGRVTLSFKNAEIGAGYTLIEENANGIAALSEYVSEVFRDDYTTVDESGMVIYINRGGAAWIDNGILFKLKITSGTLTRKQIITIATTK